MDEYTKVHTNLDLDGNAIKGAKVNEVPAEDGHIVNKAALDNAGTYNTDLVNQFPNTMKQFGAIPPGTNVKDKTIKEILDMAMYEDTPPTFTEAVIPAVSLGNKMIGTDLVISFTPNITLNDRPSVVSAKATIVRNPEGYTEMTVTIGQVASFASTPVHKSLAPTVKVTVEAMNAKNSAFGNLVNPPSPYDVQTELSRLMTYTALYPYFIKLFAKTDALPNLNTVTFAELMALGVQSISNAAFCETAGAEYTHAFSAGQGPYFMLIALQGNVNLNVKIDGTDDISSTFTKTLRTLTVPNLTGVTPQYSLFWHDTGVVPFGAALNYILKR